MPRALPKTRWPQRARAGIRIIGPNCLGLIVPGAGIDATFAADAAMPGNLAFLSQSGALITAVLDWAKARDIGFSAVVSVGDMLDVGLDELVTLMGAQAGTDGILVYLEGLADARPLLAAIRALSRHKPVIVLKAGRTNAAARAARSHTGALAGAYDVYRAGLRQAGAVLVESLEELFDAAAVLARFDLLDGDRLGIVTNGGGAGILAVDAMAGQSGTLAVLGDETLAQLGRALPPTWSHGNPVDIIGDAGIERYRAASAAVLADPQVDALLVMNCPTAVADSTAIARARSTRSARRRPSPCSAAGSAKATHAGPATRLRTASWRCSRPRTKRFWAFPTWCKRPPRQSGAIRPCARWRAKRRTRRASSSQRFALTGGSCSANWKPKRCWRCSACRWCRP